MLPERAGCGRGLFGGRSHGALVLFAERVDVGVCVGRRVRAYRRLHPGADGNEDVRTHTVLLKHDRVTCTVCVYLERE